MVQVWISGDFKGTINPAIQAKQYPLPQTEDIFANLAGGRKFSKIDLCQAYHQIELEEESRKYLTINMYMGLFQYIQLVFGITLAPAILQCTMDQILEGTSGISCILDDMIVISKSDAEHLANLEEVLRWLHLHGLRTNRSKFKKKFNRHKGRVTTTARANYCGPVLPNPPSQLSQMQILQR